MSPSNLAIVGLRLLGIFFLIEALPLFSAALFLSTLSDKMNEPAGVSMPGLRGVLIYALVPGVSYIVAGCSLFFFAVPLARRISPLDSGEADKTTWSFEDVQAMVFAAVGIVIVANALPSLGRALENLYAWYGFPQTGAEASSRLRDDWMYSAGVIAQIMIGLMMVLKPRGFRKIWHWLRTAGTRSEVPLRE